MFFSKNNSRKKFTSNRSAYLWTIIYYTHDKLEELSLTNKKHFLGSSTLLCVLNKISHKKLMCAV